MGERLQAAEVRCICDRLDEIQAAEPTAELAAEAQRLRNRLSAHLGEPDLHLWGPWLEGVNLDPNS
jgi:hypothetical protein